MSPLVRDSLGLDLPVGGVSVMFGLTWFYKEYLIL